VLSGMALGFLGHGGGCNQSSLFLLLFTTVSQ
jgi:hypothetical protein